jgi:hypothetical protein
MTTMLQPESGTTERRYTGEAHILDSSGDTRITWDKDSPDEVAAARETFERMTKGGKFSAFEQKRMGQRGARVSAFDAEAEKLVLVPQYAGG